MATTFKRYDIFMYLSENITTDFKQYIDLPELRELKIYLKSLAILLENIEESNFRINLKEEDKFYTLINQMEVNAMKYKEILEANNLDDIFSFDEFVLKNNTLIYRNSYDLKAFLLKYINFISILSDKLYKKYKKSFENITEQIRLLIFTSDKSDKLFGKQYNVFGFFSYSYLDKLFTLGIFLLFLNNNTLLYLDWIYNSRKNNGIKLKNYINSIMKECDFLLFLRTINSEINTKGNYQIRQWCSWEIGNFYQYQNSNRFKFCIDTLNNHQNINMLLEDFIIINDINDYKEYF